MKLLFKKILRRVTGISTPFFGISWNQKKSPPIKCESPSSQVFFALGNLLVTLSWVKHTEDNIHQLTHVYTKALTLMDLLKFPCPVVSELKAFFKGKADLDEQGDMKKVGERMLSLRDLFIITIRNEYGIQCEKIFSFGFTLSNVIYMCEDPAVVPIYKDFIQQNLSTLVNDANYLELPTEKLKGLVSLCRKATTTEKCNELYSESCKSLTMYEDRLKDN